MQAPRRRRSSGHAQLARATVFDMSPIMQPDHESSRIAARRHTFDVHATAPRAVPLLPSTPRRRSLRAREDTRHVAIDGDASAAPLRGWVVPEAVRDRIISPLSSPEGGEAYATPAFAAPQQQLAAPPIARPHPPAVAASASRLLSMAADETASRRALARPEELRSPTSVTCELPSNAARRDSRGAARLEPNVPPVVAERVRSTITDDEEWQHIENLAGEWQHLDSAKQKQLLSKAIFGAALRCEARGAKGVWEPRATATALPALERPPAL